ncbi:MAG: hypothetical protein JWO78_1580 [Micavibrio sp.]|nr:hypothetical protein [Micavibrio sp.]
MLDKGHRDSLGKAPAFRKGTGMRLWTVIAGLFGLGGVVAGAYAAHGIDDAHAAEMVKTAAFYALIHAAVLIGWDRGYGRMATFARLALATGILFFSGSITAKYILHYSAIGDLAPVGGVLLMAGWALIVVNSVFSKAS